MRDGLAAGAVFAVPPCPCQSASILFRFSSSLGEQVFEQQEQGQAEEECLQHVFGGGAGDEPQARRQQVRTVPEAPAPVPSSRRQQRDAVPGHGVKRQVRAVPQRRRAVLPAPGQGERQRGDQAKD